MLLWELFAQDRAFHDQMQQIKDIGDRQQFERNIVDGFRPPINQIPEKHHEISSLIQKCWQSSPTQRPSAQDVLLILSNQLEAAKYSTLTTLAKVVEGKQEQPLRKNVIDWTVDEVIVWLATLNLVGDYTHVFKSQGINGYVLSSLTEIDLSELGIEKFGDKRTITKMLTSLERSYQFMQ